MVVWFATRAVLIAEVDRGLRERQANLMARSLVLPGLSLEPTRPDGEIRRGMPLMVIADATGERQRSPHLDSDDDLLGMAPEEDRITDGVLSDGRQVRVLRFTLPIRPRREHVTITAQVAIASDVSGLHTSLHNLRTILLGAVGGASLLAVLFALWQRRLILQPVARIADDLAALAPDTLGMQMPETNVPAELTTLVQRLNGYIASLDQVRIRERMTLTGLAHELKSPIAGLRTTLEFAQRREDGAAAHATYATCRAIVGDMQTVADHLLLLAQIEAGQTVMTPGSGDVVEVVHSTWAVLAARAAERAVELTMDLPATIAVALSESWLRLVIGNVLENLVNHAPAGSSASVQAERSAGGWRLMVENPLPAGVSDPEQAFQPFWRGDPARAIGSHCGLGLTLCQRIVGLAGGRITLIPDPDRFRICLELPSADSGTGPPK